MVMIWLDHWLSYRALQQDNRRHGQHWQAQQQNQLQRLAHSLTQSVSQCAPGYLGTVPMVRTYTAVGNLRPATERSVQCAAQPELQLSVSQPGR